LLLLSTILLTTCSYSFKGTSVPSHIKSIAIPYVEDRSASGHGRAAMYRGHSWYNVDVGAREARLWGVPLTSRGKISTYIGDFLLNRFREKDFHVTGRFLPMPR